MAMPLHFLVVDAPYYEDLSAELLKGVAAELSAIGATHDYLAVPGVLEIPAAVAMAVSGKKHYDGYITIGCVIRGETTHYEIVSNESARALMDLSIKHEIALGNGIQTVENQEQAWARAKVDDKNKGGWAARAAIDMIAIKESLK